MDKAGLGLHSVVLNFSDRISYTCFFRNLSKLTENIYTIQRNLSDSLVTIHPQLKLHLVICLKFYISSNYTYIQDLEN